MTLVQISHMLAASLAAWQAFPQKVQLDIHVSMGVWSTLAIWPYQLAAACFFWNNPNYAPLSKEL